MRYGRAFHTTGYDDKGVILRPEFSKKLPKPGSGRAVRICDQIPADTGRADAKLRDFSKEG